MRRYENVVAVKHIYQIFDEASLMRNYSHHEGNWCKILIRKSKGP